MEMLLLATPEQPVRWRQSSKALDIYMLFPDGKEASGIAEKTVGEP